MPIHQRDPAAKKLREGKLLKHKAKFLGRDWKKRFVILYSDSSLVWYEEEEDKKPEGSLHLRSLAPFIIMGKYTNNIGHRRPPLPEGGRIELLIAIGTGADNDDKIHWFLPTNDDEFMAWVSDIGSVLPSGPGGNRKPRPPPSAPASDEKGQPIYPALPGEQEPPQGPGNVPPYQPGPPRGQQYPPRPQYGYQYPPAPGYQQPYRPAPAPSQPNVIVVQQPDNPHYGGGNGRSGPGFGTGIAAGGLGGLAGGMLLGSAMSGGFRPHHHMGGWGCGSGWGHSRHSSDDEDGDTTIVHNYDIDNTTIINNPDEPANEDYGGGNNDAWGGDFGGGGDSGDWAGNKPWESNFDGSGDIGGGADSGAWGGNFDGGGDDGGAWGGNFDGGGDDGGGDFGGDFGGGDDGGGDFGGDCGGGDDGGGD